jgi:virginiamycin B lyase
MHLFRLLRITSLLAIAISMVATLISGAQAGPSASFTFYTDPSLSSPSEVTTGPDGALWFTNAGNGSIGRIDTNGVISNYVDWPATGGVRGITSGPDGALWFTSYYNFLIGRISTTGSVTSFSDPGIQGPWGITTGPDGALWFTNNYDNSIGRITTSGVVTHFTDSSIDYPIGITAGSDGALWFTNSGYSNNRRSIGRITTDGTVTSFPAPESVYPVGITAGPDGALWFTSNVNPGSVGRITTDGAITIFTDPGMVFPLGITTGSDGALWFTNQGNDTIGRITTSGAVSFFEDEGIAVPYGIASGSDGAVWFTNTPWYSTSIGRLGPDTTPPTLSVSVSPSVLWPPDHKYVTVQATVTATDDSGASPTIELVSVTSNEPDNGFDDGDTVNDILINPANSHAYPDTFRLRAERASTAAGRKYTVTYKATDASGNSRTAADTVIVPITP